MKRKSHPPEDRPVEATEDRPQQACPALYQVVVECQDERQQQALFEQLRQKGYPCRLLML
ncbi:hypothetical protein [Bremerella cremea]|uniref:hypothetical protein n=1 Tax=Bremerella cremea TaxID=1031537 RepID=UPI0013149D59|nr:hypothetical protein [Bremerella cremea]